MPIPNKMEAEAMDEKTMLTERSPELLAALGETIGQTLGLDGPIMVQSLHTGGGCYVAAVDLSQDGRFLGRQVWLTREDDWMIGFYDFAADPEDEGVCNYLLTTVYDRDDPQVVADRVAGMLRRLGVQLQGG